MRSDIGSTFYELLFNLSGQKVSIWNAATGAVVEEDTRMGAAPIALYQGGNLYYEHQDWVGTERMLTNSSGAEAGTYASLPFGDGFTDAGTDLDPYHFAGLDHDYESGLDHAQYREYTGPGGRWLSPDPYDGSYDFSNPQSFNRYAYVMDDPLSFNDPSGQDGCTVAVLGSESGPFDTIPAAICAFELLGGSWITDHLLGWLFGGSSFHGSLEPRPSSPSSTDGSFGESLGIPTGPTAPRFTGGGLADILGLGGSGCEFGACGGGGFFAGPGMEDHHIFPQAFQEWFEQHGIDIESYTIALTKAAHRLKPGGLHTRSGGNWNAAWKQWIEEHPNATPQEIINQGKQFLIEFGVGAGDVFSDFFIIVNPCVTNPNMPQCQTGYNLTMPVYLFAPQPVAEEGM